MRTPTGIDDFPEKWEECTVQEKSLLIKEFLNEFGEHATWEEWCSFLKEHQIDDFEWAKFVD